MSHSGAQLGRVEKWLSLFTLCTFYTFSFCIICLFVSFLVALGLHRGVKAFSGCGERGLFYSWGARASDRGGFSCCGARALGTWVSVVAAPGLWSTGSVVVVAWI